MAATAAGDPDERVLSYGDVVLVASDLSLLRGPHWINDRIIAFYFTHLSLSPPPSPELLFLPPSVAFLLSHIPDAAGSLDLRSRALVFLPVTDSEDPSVPNSGSHWSLLIYRPQVKQFVHHDSFSGYNRSAARRLAAALDSDAGLVEARTPQQHNGYDCGVFVMAIAEAVVKWYHGGVQGEDWVGAVDGSVMARVQGMRWEVLQLILNLMDKK